MLATLSTWGVVLLVLGMAAEILSLRDVMLHMNPEVVHFGQDSALRCSYDLEGAPLYCVKFYRGSYEFYRYTPKELPSTKIFSYEGIHVDLKQSNEHQVVLKEVGFNLSGKFTCEVTTDGSIIKTAAFSKDMLVIALPKHRPVITTDRSFYYVGDVLRANCTSPAARPAATLEFMLNNRVVCEKCATRKYLENQMWRSELLLEIPLFPSHFSGGKIPLRCTARIGNLYERDVQMNIHNVNEPIPARVRQNSVGRHDDRTFNLISILFLLTLMFLYK